MRDYIGVIGATVMMFALCVVIALSVARYHEGLDLRISSNVRAWHWVATSQFLFASAVAIAWLVFSGPGKKQRFRLSLCACLLLSSLLSAASLKSEDFGRIEFVEKHDYEIRSSLSSRTSGPGLFRLCRLPNSDEQWVQVSNDTEGAFAIIVAKEDVPSDRTLKNLVEQFYVPISITSVKQLVETDGLVAYCVYVSML